MAIQQPKLSKILAIGDSCIDIYAFGNCQRLSPEAPVPIFKESSRDSRPGMVLNVAQNLINLENQVEVITNSIKATKTRLIDSGFMHHLLRLDHEPTSGVFCMDLLSSINLTDFNTVVISDYNKGFLDYETCRFLCEKFSSSNVPIFVDSKKRDLRCFENAIIKINAFENSMVTHFPSVCKLIVTHGPQGAEFENKSFAAYEIEKKMINDYRDVAGAGDTFLAALVHEYLKSDGNLYKSIEFANKCAAIAVNKFGTYAITYHDLDKLESLK